jgi:hypothetical protein
LFLGTLGRLWRLGRCRSLALLRLGRNRSWAPLASCVTLVMGLFGVLDGGGFGRLGRLIRFWESGVLVVLGRRSWVSLAASSILGLSGVLGGVYLGHCWPLGCRLFWASETYKVSWASWAALVFWFLASWASFVLGRLESYASWASFDEFRRLGWRLSWASLASSAALFLGVLSVLGGVCLGRRWRLRVRPSWASWTYSASWATLVLGDVGLGRHWRLSWASGEASV